MQSFSLAFTAIHLVMAFPLAPALLAACSHVFVIGIGGYIVGYHPSRGFCQYREQDFANFPTLRRLPVRCLVVPFGAMMQMFGTC